MIEIGSLIMSCDTGHFGIVLNLKNNDSGKAFGTDVVVWATANAYVQTSSSILWWLKHDQIIEIKEK